MIKNGKESNQEANGALFKIQHAFLVARVARSELGVKNEPPELLVIHVPVLIQALRPRVPLIHHWPPPPNLVPH